MQGGRQGPAAYCSKACKVRMTRERSRKGMHSAHLDYRDADATERRRRRAPEPARPTTCRYCGGPLPKNRRPQTRLCGDRCRKRTAADARLHSEARVQFEEASAAERKRRTEAKKPRYCDQCGKRIQEDTMRKRYCSDACSKKGAYESYRSNPAAVELNRVRNREYARRRYATAEGKASYLAASKRYHDRLKAAAAGVDAPPEAAIRPRGRSTWVYVGTEKSMPRRGKRGGRRASASRPSPARQGRPRRRLRGRGR